MRLSDLCDRNLERMQKTFHTIDSSAETNGERTSLGAGLQLHRRSPFWQESKVLKGHSRCAISLK
jgi:hypothetical protein